VKIELTRLCRSDCSRHSGDENAKTAKRFWAICVMSPLSYPLQQKIQISSYSSTTDLAGILLDERQRSTDFIYDQPKTYFSSTHYKKRHIHDRVFSLETLTRKRRLLQYPHPLRTLWIMALYFHHTFTPVFTNTYHTPAQRSTGETFSFLLSHEDYRL
jgi:hypothetical protein